MKRILFVTESLARGGMEKMQVVLANALAEHGYSVTVLCYDGRAELKADLNDNVRYIYKPRNEFPILSKIPRIQRRYNYRKFAWEKRVSAQTLYRYYVGKEKYDVEIAFYRGPSVKIVSGSTNPDSIKLAWVHTDYKLCDQRTIVGWFNDLDKAKSAYSSFDNICCVSSQAKLSFEEHIGFAEKTCTVYNMIPMQEIIEKSKELCPLSHKKFTLISVGRLIPDKCIDRLLNATKQLTDEGYEFDLWIVGGGRAEEELKNHCKELKLTNVAFCGMQENPYCYMKNADLFVLSSRREGFALVIPEAMACGLPVISTKCTGPTEILDKGNYGILAENSDEGVFEAIKYALDKELLTEYAEKSLSRAKDFSTDKIIKDVIALIEQR